MSKLYLVPTPIGNLKDITFRAIEVLQEVDLILAEDTRTSGKLLKHFEITTQMHSHHMHNEHKTTTAIVARIKSGQSVALISDAGTPAISDPGFLLTRACVEAGIEVDCLPGATAFVPALVNSGLPNDKFAFVDIEFLFENSNLGISILPQSATTNNYSNDLINILPFENPIPFRRVAMAFRQGSSKQPSLVKIVESITSVKEKIIVS